MSQSPATDQYVLGQLLGRGNFGEVYRAQHSYLPKQEVAIKLLRPQMGADLQALLMEARSASALPDHDNVVKVRDAGIWSDGRVFIATELCEGGSLEDLLIGGAMDTGNACVLTSAACRGLSHVHRAGLLHLDIRPANIMMGENGVPKLTDFGLSQWAKQAQVANFHAPHAAPEFVELGVGTAVSDVYAMAMTLAHLLTGGAICRPFPDSAQLVADSANGDWPRLDELGINVTSRLRKVIGKATSYFPERRHADIEAFKRDLDKATPAIGLGLYEDGSLRSVDERWVVEVTRESRSMQSVVVRRAGRKRSNLCLTSTSEREVDKHLRKIVKLLAEGGEQ